MQTTYARDALLDHIHGTSGFTSPANVYGQLVTSTPTPTAAGTAHGARQALTYSAATAAGAIDLSSAAAFTGLTAGTSVVGVEVWDASSGGNRLLAALMGTTVVHGTTLTLPSIPWQLAGWLSAYAAQKWLDHLLRNTAWTAPTAYVAPMTAIPAADGTGGTQATGITRQACAFDAATTNATTGLVRAISAAAEAWTVSADSEIAGLAAFDASTNGNQLWAGRYLDTGRGTIDLLNGDTLSQPDESILAEAA